MTFHSIESDLIIDLCKYQLFAVISFFHTIQVILDYRRDDSSSRGFNNHQFLTVHMWDESPYGVWRTQFINKNR